ncbi:TPA: general secretion pathway protein GspD, partial [Burkholderia territorii]|nr:general secretion pathway protein GspD [Burkholderia territorii]
QPAGGATAPGAPAGNEVAPAPGTTVTPVASPAPADQAAATANAPAAAPAAPPATLQMPAGDIPSENPLRPVGK